MTSLSDQHDLARLRQPNAKRVTLDHIARRVGRFLGNGRSGHQRAARRAGAYPPARAAGREPPRLPRAGSRGDRDGKPAAGARFCAAGRDQQLHSQPCPPSAGLGGGAARGGAAVAYDRRLRSGGDGGEAGRARGAITRGSGSRRSTTPFSGRRSAA